MLNITLPGGVIREVEPGTTIDALCRDISMGLYRNACAAHVNGKVADLRNEPLKEIGGTKVIRIRDYQDGSIYVAGLGKVETMDMKNSNILYYELADGTSFIVRPSGTEPLIRITMWGKDENTINSLANELKTKLGDVL